MRLRCLPAAVGLALAAAALSLPVFPASAAAPAAAGEGPAASSGEATVLDAVIVVATRGEERLDAAPASVTVVPRAEIERTQAQDLRELFRYEPSVTVGGSAGRFGLGDLRIRGLGGNRVQVQVDGVDVADAFSIGSFADADRDAVDVSILKQVEVLRGPASALYGSDALGGTVRFVTLDPEDLLQGEAFRTRVRAGVSGVDTSRRLGLSLAGAPGGFSWLLHAQARDGHETRSAGKDRSEDARRTAANPSDQRQHALLAKGVFEPADGHRLRLTLDASETQAKTEVLSARGESLVFGQRIRVQGLAADDRKTRARLSLDGRHELGSGLAEVVRWSLHRQDSETVQRTDERRATVVAGAAVNPVRRERQFDFFQREQGLELTAETRLGGHALLYGLQHTEADIRQKRDGRATNLTTGASSNVIFPDVFPVRDFPLSRTRETGLFAQLDLDLLDGRLRLVPALRHDRYRLSPSLDPIFAEDNPGFVPTGLRASRTSPKLGLTWRLGETLSLFANAASGFRAPPYDDANLGFTNVASGYVALPNPDLKPETSRGLDLGLRGDTGALQWTLGLHASRYRDFIESRAAVGIDPLTGLLQFQSVNRSRVETWGAEASARLALDGIGWEGGYLRFAGSRSRGIDRTDDAWLASIDPLRGSLGLGWRGDTAGVELAATGVARRRDLTLAPGEAVPFVAPGHALFDLLADLELGPRWRLEAAVFNLADRKVWDPSDTAGVPASSTVLDRYTRPGRHARITLTAAF